jgi:hypothetical protein
LIIQLAFGIHQLTIMEETPGAGIVAESTYINEVWIPHAKNIQKQRAEHRLLAEDTYIKKVMKEEWPSLSLPVPGDPNTGYPVWTKVQQDCLDAITAMDGSYLPYPPHLDKAQIQYPPQVPETGLYFYWDCFRNIWRRANEGDAYCVSHQIQALPNPRIVWNNEVYETLFSDVPVQATITECENEYYAGDVAWRLVTFPSGATIQIGRRKRVWQLTCSVLSPEALLIATGKNSTCGQKDKGCYVHAWNENELRIYFKLMVDAIQASIRN